MAKKTPFTVVCPACDEPRETTALAGMRLVCKGCGTRYAVPASSAADELPVARTPAPKKSPAPDEVPPSGPATTTPAPAATTKVTPAPRPASGTGEPSPERQARAKETGRRGGQARPARSRVGAR